MADDVGKKAQPVVVKHGSDVSRSCNARRRESWPHSMALRDFDDDIVEGRPPTSEISGNT
jgi:hypothetical protein